MRKFIVGRVLSIIPVLIIVSVVIFSVVHLTPGDPAASILGDEATVEDIAALRAKMGLDKPLPGKQDEKEAEKRKTKRKAVRRNKQRTALNMQKYET